MGPMIANLRLAFSSLNWLYLSVSIITFMALLSFASYVKKSEAPLGEAGHR